MQKKAGDIARIGPNGVRGEVAAESEVPNVILQKRGKRTRQLLQIIPGNGRRALALITASMGRLHVLTLDVRRVADKPPLRVGEDLEGSVEA